MIILHRTNLAYYYAASHAYYAKIIYSNAFHLQLVRFFAIHNGVLKRRSHKANWTQYNNMGPLLYLA